MHDDLFFPRMDRETESFLSDESVLRRASPPPIEDGLNRRGHCLSYLRSADAVALAADGGGGRALVGEEEEVEFPIAFAVLAHHQVIEGFMCWTKCLFIPILLN